MGVGVGDYDGGGDHRLIQGGDSNSRTRVERRLSRGLQTQKGLGSKTNKGVVIID